MTWRGDSVGGVIFWIIHTSRYYSRRSLAAIVLLLSFSSSSSSSRTHPCVSKCVSKYTYPPRDCGASLLFLHLALAPAPSCFTFYQGTSERASEAKSTLRENVEVKPAHHPSTHSHTHIYIHTPTASSSMTTTGVARLWGGYCSPSFTVKADCSRYGLAVRNKVAGRAERKKEKKKKGAQKLRDMSIVRVSRRVHGMITSRGGEKVPRCSICRHQLSQARTRRYFARCTMWRVRCCV